MLPQVRRLPRAPGVYRFRDAQGRVLYVGRATDLRGRVASYWSDLGDRRHLARMVARVARLEAVACDSVHEAAWLERNVLERSLPRWNRTPGGQEVPVHVRLDPGPARPGLTVTHVPGPGDFGPYLGGGRARAALAAVHRVHPLAYAGSGLTGAEREMAARRGITPADHPRLLNAVSAVLHREPEAVSAATAALTGLRDRASAGLAFEHAARIQAELLALQWLVSPQRAAVTGGGDLVVTGWSDGVRISLEIRAGRLCGWTQRRAGRPRAAGPPPGWAGFARRNAELAAALAAD